MVSNDRHCCWPCAVYTDGTVFSASFVSAWSTANQEGSTAIYKVLLPHRERSRHVERTENNGGGIQDASGGTIGTEIIEIRRTIVRRGSGMLVEAGGDGGEECHQVRITKCYLAFHPLCKVIGHIFATGHPNCFREDESPIFPTPPESLFTRPENERSQQSIERLRYLRY